MSNNTRTFHEDFGSDVSRTATFDLARHAYKIVIKENNYNNSTQQGTCAEFESGLQLHGTFQVGQNGSFVLVSIDDAHAYLKNDKQYDTSMPDFKISGDKVTQHFSLPMECQVDPSKGIKGIPTISTDNTGSSFCPLLRYTKEEK